jgi:hypothetical protein
LFVYLRRGKKITYIVISIYITMGSGSFAKIISISYS